jgi:hypothetical protein
VGRDLGKYRSLAVVRWADGRLERPWLVNNPEQVPLLVGLLRGLSAGHAVTVALKPSGPDGDPVRQAVAGAGLRVLRVSPKAAHAYAEVFDGGPSPPDGKEAASQTVPSVALRTS